MVDFNTIMPTVDQPRKAQQVSEAREGPMADERKRVSDAIEKTIRLKAERLAMTPPPVEKVAKSKAKAKIAAGKTVATKTAATKAAATKATVKAPAKPRTKPV